MPHLHRHPAEAVPALPPGAAGTCGGDGRVEGDDVVTVIAALIAALIAAQEKAGAMPLLGLAGHGKMGKIDKNMDRWICSLPGQPTSY